MSTSSTPNNSATTGRMSTSSTTTYTAPPAYTPSDTSSIKSTSSTIKKSLMEVFARELSSKETPPSNTKGLRGKDGLTAEERRIRDEARASYYSTI